MFILSIISVLLIEIFSSSESARILASVFTPSYSHQIAFQPIWRELSLRGHQITLLTTNPMNDPSLINITEIDLSSSYEIMARFNTDKLLSSKNESMYSRMKTYMQALNATADFQFSLPQVQTLLNNKSEHFDLLMIEVIYPTHMALAHRFKAPFIGLVSLDALPRLHSSIGNPIHPVLYPDVNLPFDKDLSFFERLASSVFLWFMLLYGDFRLYPSQDITVRKYFGEDAPSLKEIQSNMSLLFINASPLVQNVRPLVPTTIQIGGGLHMKKSEQLPQDIQEFLDKSAQGVIYFSLGTNVKSAALDANIKSAILEAFAEVPYEILWKFEDHIEDLPENIKIIKWAPQTAILAHDNVKVFITQCGLQSMEEAIFYNKPMVGLPFYGDQRNNAKILKTKQLGIALNPDDLNKNEFLQAILEVARNPIFKTNLKKIKTLLEDQQISGLDKAIWWTEYVLRHNGTEHLRCAAADLPLYQYFMIDVLGFILIIISAVFYVIYKIIKYAFKLCFSKKHKQD